MTLQLTGNDKFGSLQLAQSAGSSTTYSWGPFGGAAKRIGAAASLPGFNGERQDPLSGTTHLGNGYRAYSPALRRFTCPDNESPFGVGGLNSYVYCDNDAVNRTDPSGHGPVTWLLRKTLKLGIKMGLALPEESLASGLTTAGAVETGTEIAGQLASGVSSQIAKARGNTGAARDLGWVSLGLGVASCVGIGQADISQTLKKLRGPSRTYRVADAAAASAAAADEIDNVVTLGGTMQKTTPIVNGLYTFTDTYKGKPRLNIVAHGTMLDGSSRISLGEATRKELVSAPELYKILQDNYNLTDYNSIRLLSCHSADGGRNSFAATLSKLTNMHVKGFCGTLTMNFTSYKVTDLFYSNEHELTYPATQIAFNSRKMTIYKKKSPFSPDEPQNKTFGYRRVHFGPRK